jgi:hypothetical protein
MLRLGEWYGCPPGILIGSVCGLELARGKNKFFLNRTWLSDLKIRDNPGGNIRYNLGAPKFSIRIA